jgi:DNA invertase Pin-like site-specific DNA recombinase
MIKSTFDPKREHRYVRYARMSSELQNPRSPEQQFDEIEREVKRSGCPWIHVKDYRDDGISGRYASKRPGFSQMLEDIKTRKITVDLILVDTLERFGRMSNLDHIRDTLAQQYGVLILTADSKFADPTDAAGRALKMIESMRSTQDAGVKAHNVLRGKRDAARCKHWPGGPPPLGYKLESVMIPGSEPLEVDYRILIPDPATVPLVKEIFRLAVDEGLGSTRVAKMLNANSEWRKLHGTFYSDSIGRILSNPIYCGTLLYGRVATDVISDRRVICRNGDDKDILRVENFCEPLVDAGVWKTAQSLRAARGVHIRKARAARKASGGKQIMALSPGMTLKYPLSGLVRCGICGASMRPNSGAGSKSGPRNAYYMCPRRHSGACANAIYCREPWLRKAVFAALRERLFPMSSRSADAAVPEWFEPLVREIQLEYDRVAGERCKDEIPRLKQELETLTLNIAGWTQSLANPKLPASVRRAIEAQFEEAASRQAQLELEISQAEDRSQTMTQVINAEDVIGCLRRLDQVMAGGNATLTNFELSRHVEAVEVFPDGRVVMRTCRIGVFEGAIKLLCLGSAGRQSQTSVAEPDERVRQRLRRKLSVDPGADPLSSEARKIDAAADPQRFDGLDFNWFWEDVFEMPAATCWAAEHAAEVADRRAEGWTMRKLSESFGKSIPTIRHALKISAERAANAEGESSSSSSEGLSWAASIAEAG